MFEPSRPISTYIAKRGLIAIAITLACSIALILGGMDNSANLAVNAKRSEQTAGSLIILLLVFAPLLETGIVALLATILMWTKLNRVAVCILIGIFLGYLHWIGNPLQGYSVVIGFIINAAAYIAWRAESRKTAYFICAAMHAVVNIPALLVYVFL